MKLPAIRGGQFPNDALLSRYKSAKDGGALISPQQPRISSSGQSSTGRLTFLDILSASVGCNTLHLASKVVCKGIPLDPFLQANLHAGTASPCAQLYLSLYTYGTNTPVFLHAFGLVNLTKNPVVPIWVQLDFVRIFICEISEGSFQNI